MAITLKNKKNTTKAKPKVARVNTYILVDSSGSMQSYSKEVVQLINNQLKDIRNSDLQIYTSLYTFNDVVTTIFSNKSKNNLPDVDTYLPIGSTSLNDALVSVLDPNSKDINQLIIITDGQENTSRTATATVVSLIKNCLNSDQWTIGFCCPKGDKNTIVNVYQIPEGSVQVWNTTSAGVNTLSTQLSVASTNYYSNIKRGVKNTKSSYFAPDLNITKTEVKRNLDNVTNNYHIKNVTNKDDLTAASFVTSKRLKFVVGCLYYQLTKRETLQDYKNIVLMKNSDGTLYSGEEVRNILSIPEGGTISINPSFSPDWTVFVRSTSWNRKLVPSTKVLIQK